MFWTNVIVAAIRSASGASRILLELVGTGSGRLTAVLTDALVNEYEDVLFRSGIRSSGWSDADLHAVVDSLLVTGDWIEIHYRYRPVLPDPSDELVLEAAINGQANIVTFNVKHFRPAIRFGLQVMKPGQVLEMLNEGSAEGGAK